MRNEEEKGSRNEDQRTQREIFKERLNMKNTKLYLGIFVVMIVVAIFMIVRVNS